MFQQTSVKVLADSVVFPFLWDFRMGNTVLVGGGGSSLCFFTVLLAKELFGEKEALWSGFSLTTCFHFIYEHCAKTGEMDAIPVIFPDKQPVLFDSQREKSTLVNDQFGSDGIGVAYKKLRRLFADWDRISVPANHREMEELQCLRSHSGRSLVLDYFYRLDYCNGTHA